jgi:sterol desaturase/sphingolipid hydroxylase (fatty acid hydroxylase superfamily)
MNYSAWLFGLAVFFLLAERLWPRRQQPVLRHGWATDLAYLIWNGEYLGMLLGAITIPWAEEAFSFRLMANAPLALQCPVLLLSFDLAQWLIHNLMHRVPWLWRFHQVHHSIQQMDWIGNWRFHWVEVVVYKVLLYPLAAVLGFRPEAMFAYAVVTTLIGNFAHANLRWPIGPLRYLINSPEMHLWHHAHPVSGPIHCNFGITLSLWDWLFRTAHLPPAQDPAHLGFAGVESYPTNILTQTLEPFRPKPAPKPAPHR